MNKIQTDSQQSEMPSQTEGARRVGCDGLLGIWECFSDPCYYDMWAVRRTHERGWGECFHMNSAEEAKALTAMLNHAAMETERARSRAAQVKQVITVRTTDDVAATPNDKVRHPAP